ncbi:MAG: hypothetical protein KGD63_15535 [Candidatus Lokiarchaeota archaeon]|nr:hypothetical protein [Candidatus Lokiarchaeota archaeon]
MAYYRGYILIRLKIVGKEWDVVEKLKDLHSKEEDEDWKVTYAIPVYGAWDIMIECSFSQLSELDKVVTYCRIENELSQWIEETTTLVGTKPDYS